jgi:hypothetical protein
MRSPRPLLNATAILGLVRTLSPVGIAARQSIARAWASATARRSVLRVREALGPGLWINHTVAAALDREQAWALRAGDEARPHRDRPVRTRRTTPLLSGLTTSLRGTAPTGAHR